MRAIPYIFCVSIFFTTGCWDRMELNDRSIWLATGMDAKKDGEIRVSGQVVIPSTMQPQGGSTGDKFFVISAGGKSVNDALSNIQGKLSREIFLGQRRSTLIGETLAKRGLKKHLDFIVRPADLNMRTGAFIIKNGTAEEALRIIYPLELISSLTALKEYGNLAKHGDDTMLNFLVAANSEGIPPILPAVEIKSQEENHSNQEVSSNASIEMAGVAIFNQDLKLRGYLNMKESKDLYWIKGILKKNTLSLLLHGENASLNVIKMSSKFIPEKNEQNKIKMTLKLKCKGMLVENNTNLDLLDLANVKILEKKMEEMVKKEVMNTIKKVQTEYRTDVFGFGEAIHRKYPDEWKKMKGNWEQSFSELDISLIVDVKINQVGLSGPSTLYREREIKK